MEISGTDTTNNVVLGNYMGTDITGTVGLGNGGYGTVKLGGGTAGNTIGGTDPGAGNVIAASAKHGIYISRAGAAGNLVQGNYVGTNAAGTGAIPNALAGIAIDHSPNNVIGGTAAGARNVSSGNAGSGIQIWGDVSTGNTIQGNYLGTDVTGTQALANSAGVWSGSSQNTIGGTEAGAGNLISGNRNQGIWLGSKAQETIVQGNYIGTDLSGTQPLGNEREGIWLDGGANHTIGGTDPGAGNVISGNLDDGIQISGGSSGNTVLGNYIGTDVTGTVALGNDGPGVHVTGNAFGNTVGGVAAGAENVISANGQEGIRVEDFSPFMAQWESGSGGNDHYYLPTLACTWSEAESLAVQLGGHLAGVSSAEEQGFLTSTFGESLIWIGLTDEAVEGTWVWSSGEPVTYTNWAGGQPSGYTGQDYARMNWGGTGLWDDDGPAMIPGLIELSAAPDPNDVETILGQRNTLIQGNLIGTDANGAAALGNASNGIRLDHAADVLIGGTEPDAGNTISANGANGIFINGTLATGNVIQGNQIGTNATGTAELENGGDGIRIERAPLNTIGGTDPSARNVILGSPGSAGIVIAWEEATGNVVQGNYVGVDITGNQGFATQSTAGIWITKAPGNLIGGTADGAGNVVSANAGNGIQISGITAAFNVLQGNRVGTNAAGDAELGNAVGINIDNAPNNLIGGTTETERNVISGNQWEGVVIWGPLASGNHIKGNYIGTDAGGDLAIANGSWGVRIGDAPNNVIGGSDPGAGNVISGNSTGVGIHFAGATGNAVQGNYIGTNADGTADLGNSNDGVNLVSAAWGNLIGGSTPGARNVISGNNDDGIHINGDYNGQANNNTVLGNYIGTDVHGTADLGNGNNGVRITKAWGNVIGGSGAGERNVISGNGSDGVEINDGSYGNTVLGNYIGTDATGSVALGNDGPGVYIAGNAFGNTVGGTAAGAENVISANGWEGINIEDLSPLTAQWESGAGGNGHFYLPTLACTWAEAESLAVQLGGHLAAITSAEEQGFLASTFGRSNVWIGLTDEAVEGTWAWTSGEATTYTNWNSGEPNGGTGENYVSMNWGGPGRWNDWGATAMAPGLIEFVAAPNWNDVETILGPRNTLIQGNLIGTDVSGTAALGNTSHGVRLGHAADVLIGGTEPDVGNTISANGNMGVLVVYSGSTGNIVQGNHIGTNVSGTGALGNAWDGVWIDAGAHGNTIGGTSTGARNIISGNLDDGIQISGGSSGNTVLGNYIGTDATGSVALGNDGPGVYIAGNAFGNTVGGTAAGAENVISANGWEGINIEDLSPLTAQWESGVGGNGHFYLPTLACTWAEAESLAVQLGGHLAAITSAEEQEFLTSTFGRRQVWMGLTDEAVEGTWV